MTLQEIYNNHIKVNSDQSLITLYNALKTVLYKFINRYNHPKFTDADKDDCVYLTIEQILVNINTYDSNKSYNDLQYPFIFKRSKSSGGLNIFKIASFDSFNFTLRLLKARESDLTEWQLQEYVDGIPVSCTVIGNGRESALVSINRQIIGEKLCNPPKEFMYCGNVVPANLLRSDDKIIAEISLKLLV